MCDDALILEIFKVNDNVPGFGRKLFEVKSAMHVQVFWIERTGALSLWLPDTDLAIA